MKPRSKALLVAGGYAGCLLLACAAVALHTAVTSGPDRQASGGMYAFGDSLLFAGVFGVSGLVPTAVALVLLRPYPLFWRGFAGLALVVAAAGVAAAVVFAAGRGEVSTRLGQWVGFSVLWILASPVLSLAFAVCAAVSPGRPFRTALLAAAAMEAAVAAYGGAVWLLPLVFRRM